MHIQHETVSFLESGLGYFVDKGRVQKIVKIEFYLRTDFRRRALLTKIILSSSELETPESFLLLWIGSESDLLICSPCFCSLRFTICSSIGGLSCDCFPKPAVLVRLSDRVNFCSELWFGLVSRSSGMSSHIAESLLGILGLLFWKVTK